MSGFSNMLRNCFYAFLLLVAVTATACASGDKAIDSGSGSVNNNTRDTVKSGNVAKKDENRYEDYLVDIKSYSTNGGYYQDKYIRDILSITKDITEKQDIDISKGSVGFYYDKKSKRSDRLFFGFDITVKKDNDLDYGRYAVKLIKENVSGIIDEIYKYRFVSAEKDVVGIVIGFRWIDGGTNQQVNIWLKKEDINLFMEERITVNEMYQRGTVTNSTGRIILLPI